MLQENKPLSILAQEARRGLQSTFQIEGQFLATAPGRVNLIGEHIDYCDGFVLPLAIERHLVIAANLNNSSKARFATENHDIVKIDLSVTQEITGPKWSNYLRGVIQGFLDLGYQIPGFDAFLCSSIPQGAGLSSSAALECALATLIEGLVDTQLATKDKALLSQQAEHRFAKVPCGIMDQYASCFGAKDQLILIDCQSGEPEMIPFLDPSLSIIVADTCVSHNLADGEYQSRKTQTEQALELLKKSSWREVTLPDLFELENQFGEILFKRAHHVVSEIKRTVDAVEALKRQDFSIMGEYMYQSHRSLRDDFQVSCQELDLMVALAREIGFEGGVLGSRMTGGGFGGSTVTLCRTDKANAIASRLQEAYQNETGVTPLLFSTRPTQGAHLL
jgi:galactokinase